MQLSNGTYTSEVNFSLDESLAEGFYLQDNKNGSIEINWDADGMSRAEILKQRVWELLVIAEHKSLTEYSYAQVLIELADIKSEFVCCFISILLIVDSRLEDNFHFARSYYEGNLNKVGELFISPIIFNSDVYQSDMKFSLQGSDEFFYFSQQNFTIQLQLNESFAWQSVVDERRFVKLTLQASWETLTALTNIIINLPSRQNETFQEMFQFEKPLYVGRLNASYALELETIALQTDAAHMQEVQFKLIGNESDQFKVQQNGTRIQIELISNQSLAIAELISPIVLVLEAKYYEAKTFSSVIIQSAKMLGKMEKNIFPKPLMMGSLIIRNNSQQLVLKPIALANDSAARLEELNLLLSGGIFFFLRM